MAWAGQVLLPCVLQPVKLGRCSVPLLLGAGLKEAQESQKVRRRGKKDMNKACEVIRLQYIQTDLLQKIPFILEESYGQSGDHTKLRQKQIDLVNLLKLLHGVMEPKTFSKLYQDSKIRMKQSFLFYLNISQRLGLVLKQQSHHNNQYIITEKGRVFYGMLTTP